MLTLNEIRDVVLGMFPGQSLCVTADAWVHQHHDGPARSVTFRVSIHTDAGIEFHEEFETPDLLLAAVRQYREKKGDPEAKNRPIEALPEQFCSGDEGEECAHGGPENCTGCMD